MDVLSSATTNQNSRGSLDEGQTSDNTTESASGTSDEGQTNVNTSQSIATSQVQNNNQSVNINNQLQDQQRLESIIIEREGEKPIPLEEQKKIESEDQIVIREHK